MCGMIRCTSRRQSLFFVAVLFCTATAGAQYSWPDPKEGVISGRQAVMVWPSDATGALQDPAKCEVHLVAAVRPMEEQIYPCGRWFLPVGAGSFDFWVEQGTNVSDSQRSMRYSDRPGASVGARASAPLTRGGHVRLATTIATEESARLLSLSSPGFGFERRVGRSATRARILMPAGTLIAGVFSGEGNAVSLTRPITLVAGGTALAAPEPPPPSVSDLLLVLRGYRRVDGAGLKVVMARENERRAPDVLRITQTRIFAIWYGLQPGEGRILVEGDGVAYQSDVLAFSPGKITTVRSDLRQKET